MSRRRVCLMFAGLSVIILLTSGLNFVGVGLAEGPVTNMDQLIGIDWVLMQIGGLPAPKEPPVSVTFGIEGKLFGSGGCNQYHGSYLFDSGRIVISSLGATKMMCSPDIMKTEDRFLAALEGTFGLAADKDTLTLCSEDKTECLVFKAK
jgi:heat shock protein HslJ